MREPPGCPPGPPPNINDDGEVEDLYTKTSEETPTSAPTTEKDDSITPLEDSAPDSPPPKPTSLQQKMVALSGQNVDEFMKEMEKKMEVVGAPPLRGALSEPIAPPGTDIVPMANAPLIFPPTVGGGVRLPPGPPPGRPLMPPGMPPPPRMPIRMPPAPPPRMMRLAPHPGVGVLGNPPNVVSAAPQLIRGGGEKQGATISAKPQIRNLSADVTRFVSLFDSWKFYDH